MEIVPLNDEKEEASTNFKVALANGGIALGN